MESLVITPKNKTELQFLTDLFKRMNVEARFLTDEQKEDLGMIQLLKEADRSKKVPRQKIMKKLGKK